MRPPRYDLGLRDEVYTAIGLVSAQWSAVEYYVSKITQRLCETLQRSLPKDFNSLAFSRRRNALFEVICEPSMPANLQEYCAGTLLYIERGENERHMVVHGMASETEIRSPGQPSEQLVVLIRDQPKQFFNEAFTVAEIRKIAERISIANGVLFALYLHLYGVGALPELDR